MSHQILYRKYRPQKFKDVRGQDHVVQLLQNALLAEKVGHAYLFSGGRGTGKTSVARILAHELGTAPEDIYEIDAASNRGIDEIRALREGVQTLPMSSRYKVYIIDEAHMLTLQAANALLKTLEEPPKHVIFILATTDKHKLPETIISRCQNVEFKKANKAVLVECIVDIAKHEGITIDNEALNRIAERGDGSYRDTLSFLETCIIHAGTDKHISMREVQSLETVSSVELAHTIVEAALKKDVATAVSAFRDSGTDDVKGLFMVIVETLRTALLLRFDTNRKLFEDLSKTMTLERIEKVRSIGSDTAHPVTSAHLIAAIDMYERLITTGVQSEIVLEACIAELASK